MLKTALIYKKSGKVKVAYFYLKEADRIAEMIFGSPNPSLINICAQVKIYLANFLFEIRQYDKALECADKSLLILSGEIRMRINLENFIQKFNKNREKRRLKKCAKTVLSAFISIVAIYEASGQFHEMINALQTASYIAEKYVQGIDEFKKHVIKTAQEGKNKMETYLNDVSDLSYIAEQALEQELFDLNKKKKENKLTKREQDLEKFHDQMYNLFQFKQLNQNQYFLFKKNQEIYQQQQQEKDQNEKKSAESEVKEQNQGTNISINILDSDSESDESFFNASFFAPSNDKFMFDSALYQPNTERKEKKRIKNKKDNEMVVNKHRKVHSAVGQKPNKSVGLVKIGMDRGADYKSKILTSTQCLNNFEPFKEKLTVPDYPEQSRTLKYQKLLQSLDQQNKLDFINRNEKDLDLYITQKINQKIGKRVDIRPYNLYSILDILIVRVKNKLQDQFDREEFDKKEFGFGRDMLKEKQKVQKIRKQNINKVVPVKIEIDNKIKNHGDFIMMKMENEKDIKEMKLRKIEKMVAAKKIYQSDTLKDIKDPEETIHLKKALEKSKKKQLKDLILKHKDALGLRRFFYNLQREQKEYEKQSKLKLLLEKDKEQIIQLQSNANITDQQIKQSKKGKDKEKQDKIQDISIIQIDNEQRSQHPTYRDLQKSTDRATKKKKVRIVERKNSFEESPKAKIQTKVPQFKKILKKSDYYPKTTQNDDDLQGGTEYLIKMEQQIEDKRQKQEQIQKFQKKAHSVISLIIDGVEKDIDTERKELKKMIFKKRGGSNAKYVDEDEKTYAKFINSYPELCRSSHLLQIKKELGEKTFGFEDIVIKKFQINKKQTVGIASQDVYYQRLGTFLTSNN